VVEDCAFKEDRPEISRIDDLGHDLDVSEHRKGILVAFDLRNGTIMELEEPYFPGDLGTAERVIQFLREQTVEEQEIQGQGADDVDTVIEAYELVRCDNGCGLGLLYDQTTVDETVLLGHRIGCIHWVCYYSPIMARALQLAWKYCRDDKERLVVYVKDPGIQW
jgi:hypothetical protein